VGEALRECPCTEKDWEGVGAMESAQGEGESDAWESEKIWLHKMSRIAFYDSQPLSETNAWPFASRTKKDATKSTVALFKASVSAFIAAKNTQRLAEVDWKLQENKLINSWKELLMTHTPRPGGLADVSCEFNVHVTALEQELAKRQNEGDKSDEFGRRIKHIKIMIQVLQSIKASFQYCATALYDTVFAPLRAFSSASITSENFESGVEFVSWASRSVMIASELCQTKDSYHVRMTRYTKHEFLNWSRKLLDFFYHHLSSVRGSHIVETLGSGSDCAELMQLIKCLPTMRLTLPCKGTSRRATYLSDTRF